MESSVGNIKLGLQMVDKEFLNVRQWTGKFADQQHHHQYPQDQGGNKTVFGETISKNLEKFKLHLSNCGLCLKEKPKSEFYHLCSCAHSYCYSCLNSYAITRIHDCSPVVCPFENCGQFMPLSSKIYKYLPDEVKIVYLQKKQIFRPQKNGLNIE